tara:strand:- start:1315 stop:2592 length:1278 start_codon:yes stop_codon:yes gene_type:complete
MAFALVERIIKTLPLGALTTITLVGLLSFTISNNISTSTSASEIFGKIGAETRIFPNSAIHLGQNSHTTSFFVNPSIYSENSNGHSIVVSPFFRYDSVDPRRTHWDIREAYGLFFGELDNVAWEFRIGLDRVFWGVAESFHLIDIINQTDLVEDPGLKEKLGQPMIHGTLSTSMGNIETFFMPYFRNRTFHGQGSRLRNSLIVDQNQTNYESSSGRHHLDIALRHSHTIGVFDTGLSFFHGTNRSPTLELALDRYGSIVLVPTYEQISQYSLDLQATLESWLLKFEGYWRDGEKDRALTEQDYGAFIAGFEYTFYGIFNSETELSLLTELLFDGRDNRSLTAYENDIFFALRLGLNDAKSTEFFIGVMHDLDESAHSVSLEAERRIDNNWSLSLNGTAFRSINSQDIQFSVRKDTFLEFEINYNF